MKVIFCCIGACLIQVTQAQHQRQEVERRLSGTRATACESDSETQIYTGYFNVSSFVEDYREGRSFNFQMCPKGVFDEPLALPASFQKETITIACADPNAVCLWKIDKGSHLNMEDNGSLSLNVQGVSFQGATDSSIRIKPKSGQSLISFEGCDWSENNGYAVINAVEDESSLNFTGIVSGIGGSVGSTGGTISGPELEQETISDTTNNVDDNTTYTLGGRFNKDSETVLPGNQEPSDSEPTDSNRIASTKLELKNCSFHNNVVNQSIIFIGSIDIKIDGCDFVGNEVTDSLIHIKDEGLHDIYDVRFKDNRLLGAVPGIIFVSASSRFNSRGICGSNNQILQNEVCNGTAQQLTNTEECNASDDFGCTTECSPYDHCNECVSDTEELFALLEDGGNIKLCENTVFDIDFFNKPLTIGEPSVSLGCESNCTIKGGNKQLHILDGATDVSIDGISLGCESNCTIKGGNKQLHILDGATDVSIDGISFESSSDVSIKVEIDHTEPADIQIRNCQFKGHSGNSIIKLSSPEQVGPIEAKIELQNSRFVDNAGQIYLIENQGLDLSINSCKFWGNDNSSIVGALGGNTLIQDSQSWGNKLMQGLFYVSGDSTTYNVEKFCSVDDSFEGVCNGTIENSCVEGTSGTTVCKDSCEPLIENSCSIPDCLSAYEELQIAMILSPGDTYVICPDTTINLDIGDKGFGVTEPSTKIKCGENGLQEDNCVINGGSYHLMINATDVGVYGMTFVDARTTSIEINANVEEPSSITFNDCSWEKNMGLATFSIAAESADVSENSLAPVIISNSTFLMNNAEGSIISNGGSPLTISKSLFTQNSALNGSLIHIEANTATISDVEFVDNAVGESIMFLSSDAELTKTRVCGFDNEAVNDSCDGIAELVSGSLCKEGECELNCSSLMPCQAPSCFDDWEQLTRRMDKSVGGESFVLCPGSSLLLGNDGSPLRISESDIVVSCGSDGTLENQCLIIGGELQVLIDGAASGVRFEGVTFSSSKKVSIAAFGGSEASATFDGCEFSGHSGDAVVAIINNDEGTGALQDGMMIEKPTDAAMGVSINSCIFKENVIDFSPVVNVGGQVKVNETTFVSNIGLGGSGAVTSFFDSPLSVVSSCFLENQGNSSGAILLIQDKIDSFVQENNFGEDNVVSVGDCINVVLAKPSGSFISCYTFDSIECRSGAISPTISPGMPIAVPTSLPSPRKCYGEDNWETFFTDVRDSMGNEVFTLCEGLSIDIEDMESKGLAPLMIKESGVTIECAAPSTCLLSGGSSHIVLSGSIQDVAVTGLTLVDASESSIVGTLEMPSSVEFELCDWIDNKGATVVSIVTEGGNRRMSSRNLEYENLLTLKNCNFEENSASDAIIKGSESSIVLDSVIFERNTMENVVDISNGFLFLVDSCFIDSGTTSTLINNKNSGVIIDDIFLSGSDNSECVGYLDDNGGCNSLTSASSCIAEKKRCISRWTDLDDAVQNISEEDEEHIFTVCPNAVLDLSNSDPIEIKTSKTTIQCGNNGASDGNCVVKGGDIQFKIVGSPTDVLFSGITFTEASVAAINAAGGRSARASVMDCVFRDIKGAHAALLVFGGEVPSTGRRLSIEDFTEPDERSMTVQVSYSLFSSNEVHLAPIANLKGSLEVFSCKFNSNNGTTVAGGITDWFSGIMSVKKSCFTNNYGKLAGSIYVNGDSTVEMENFSEGNEASDEQCNDGLFLATAREFDGGPTGLCVAIVNSECGAKVAPAVPPTVAPTVPVRPTSVSPQIQCIQSWSALNSSISEGIQNTFTLCPDKDLLAGEDAIILNRRTEGTDIAIECYGESGETCLIKGGRRHFHILGEGIQVLFRGIKFEDSKDVSILAAGDGNSKLRFKDCEWTANKGPAAVLIYNGIMGDEYDIESLKYPGKSMSVNFDSCSFTNHTATTGVVVNIGGTVIMTTSAFKSNQDTSIGCIQCVGEDSRLELYDNCFIENDSNKPGAVFLTDGAEMRVNDGNFGYDNKVPATLTNCADIFTLAPGEMCNAITCPGTCSTFDAKGCGISGFGYAAPSLAPIPDNGNINSPFIGTIKLEETSLFTSLFFLRNICVALLTVFFGICAVFSCSKTYYGAGEKKEKKSDESNPPSKTESMSSREANGMNVKEQEVVKQKQGGLFRRGKRKTESNDDETNLVVDAECVPISKGEPSAAFGQVAEDPMELS
eukprot:CAMPEP_0194227298 /NCGR_PEP_ID=MMETSP0156-20130528/42784_1 /TAXON_ID=33649 /ORGANISM="Thalassionema nitzschioides, Strain L26-B" /LENGTH=2185 /DNA_ID=CAMNT_0038959777 /DNA_START=132 /DNA_END=6689 /DNA_ORIENTATION=+